MRSGYRPASVEGFELKVLHAEYQATPAFAASALAIFCDEAAFTSRTRCRSIRHSPSLLEHLHFYSASMALYRASTLPAAHASVHALWPRVSFSD